MTYNVFGGTLNLALIYLDSDHAECRIIVDQVRSDKHVRRTCIVL